MYRDKGVGFRLQGPSSGIPGSSYIWEIHTCMHVYWSERGIWVKGAFLRAIRSYNVGERFFEISTYTQLDAHECMSWLTP